MNNLHTGFIAILFTSFILTAATPARADDPGNEAARQFRAQESLALQGNVESQYRVGEMCEQGLGTRRDAAMAYLWYSKAARQGDARARDRLAALDRADKNATNEEARVNAATRALQQQSEQETAAGQRERKKERAAAEARAREKTAAAATTVAKTRTTAPIVPEKDIKPALTPPVAEKLPLPAALPVTAEATTPAGQPLAAEAEPSGAAKESGINDEFSHNPCKGPQARFLSLCNK